MRSYHHHPLASLLLGLFAWMVPADTLAQAPAKTPVQRAVSFRRDVAPLLLARCFSCHRESVAEGGYRLDSFAQLLRPGDSGDAVVLSGEPTRSQLYLRLIEDDASLRMPFEADPLDKDAIAIVGQWIEQGAKYDAERAGAPLASIVPHRRHPSPPAQYARAIPITAVHLDGDDVWVGGYHELLRWNWRTQELKQRLPQVGQRVYAIGTAGDGRLIVASGTPGKLGEVRVLDRETGTLLAVPLVTTDVVLDGAIAGELLAAAGADAKIHIISLKTLQVVHTIDSHSDWVSAVAWHPQGKYLASSSRDRTAKLFDAPTWQVRETYAGHQSAVVDVAFLAGDSGVVSCDASGRVHVWSLDGGAKRHDLPSPGQAALGLHAGPRAIWLRSPKQVMRVVGKKADYREPYARAPLAWAHDSASGVFATGDAVGRVRVVDTNSKRRLAEFLALPLNESGTPTTDGER